ncbi:MAG: cyclodeaminase/cyclohydrolase family protein [Christensenellales bacterium]
MDLKALSLGELATLVSQPSPSPGGGAVCAVTAALAASLTAMVCGLGKAGSLPSARARVHQAEALRDALLADAQRDSEAYAAYLAAGALPAGPSREEQAEVALKAAIDIPLEIATRALQLLPILEEARPSCPKGALPDAQVAAILARAAAKGSILNARVNLTQLRNAASRALNLAYADSLEREADGPV